jgi:SAM-dependent methyltransferase
MTTLHSGISEVKISYLERFVKPARILDVGAGTCQYSLWLRERFPQASITAVDHVMPAQALSFDFQCLDLEKSLPFEDGSFQTVLAFDVIEHIDNVDFLMQELHRILQPGGVIVGSVPHDDDKFLPAYNLTFYHRSDVTHKRYYVPKSLQELFEKQGLHEVQTWLEGGISPQVFAEFFPSVIKPVVKKGIGLLRRLGVVNASALKSDLFFVAYKK